MEGQATPLDGDRVRGLDRLWNEAYQTRDTGLLRRVLAPDWVAYLADGSSLGRDQIIEAVERNVAAELAFELLDARVFGNTAVTAGRLTISESGKEARSQRYLRVYACREGHWFAVAVQVYPEAT